MSEDLVRRSDVAPLLCSRCRESAPEFDKFGAYHGEGDRRYHCAAGGVYELPAAGKAEEPPAPAKPLTKEAIDEIARKAIDDYIAGRRDSHWNPTSDRAEVQIAAAEDRKPLLLERIGQSRFAPAKCAACDGSRRQGGWGDISDTPYPFCSLAPAECVECGGSGAVERDGLDIPCPACRGTGRRP